MTGADRCWLVLYYWVTAHARLVVGAGLLLITCGAAGLLWLDKDTSADSLVGRDNPARQYKETVAEVFGLTDPLVIAMTVQPGESIYRSDLLDLVEHLSRRLAHLDNIDPERILSLDTQKLIRSSDGGIQVYPLLERPDGTRAAPAEVQAGVDSMPLYQGSLVARDGSATLIAAGLIDAGSASRTYEEVMALVDGVAAPAGVSLHVAGDGAVSGYLSTYIDQDAFRLTPAATLIIGIVLLVAFRSFAGALLPTLVIGGTLAGAVGLMAASGTPFYVITNGLLVNLIGISVADSIHVLTAHVRVVRQFGHESHQQLVCRTMLEMWRPITLTTVTTVAGFVALALSTDMAPVTAFGMFGAVGVVIAWIYSMTLLPAAMVLVRAPVRRQPDAHRADARTAVELSWPSRVLATLVLERPVSVAAISGILVALGLLGASRIEVDDAWIDNFSPSEPLYVADQVINQRMDGVNYMDIVIESSQPEGLLQPGVLRRIEALEQFMLGLPHVQGTTSIADYVKQMNKAVNDGDPAAYSIPDDANTIAQLLLLYGFSADPTDLEEEIDSLYQSALVRTSLDRSVYRNNDRVIPAVQRYLREEFDTPTLTGTATGRVVVDYTWVRSIAESHLRSLGFATLAVFGVCLLVFRSAAAASLAMIPVLMAVLTVYGVMGLGGISLGVGTSMFAAIAIGLGVDFSVHALLRLRRSLAEHGDLDRAIVELYPDTGRALTCNFVAVALGFGILIVSSTPPLQVFGLLVAAAIAGAYVSSMTTLPALFRLSHSFPRASAAGSISARPAEVHP